MITRYIIIAYALLLGITANGQVWTETQIKEADTATDVTKLTDEERDVILFINLCRLYPQQFAQMELSDYEVNAAYSESYRKEFMKYKKSLLDDLSKRKPAGALQYDSILYADALCYSTEISKKERKAHKRIDCKESGYAECLSFGLETGRDIAIQWLVDTGVSSLGHRTICLFPAYKKTGISLNKNKKWRFCAVGEFQ